MADAPLGATPSAGAPLARPFRSGRGAPTEDDASRLDAVRHRRTRERAPRLQREFIEPMGPQGSLRSPLGPVANTLRLGPVSRTHLKQQLSCEASNTNLTRPLSAAVMIDMNRECRVS